MSSRGNTTTIRTRRGEALPLYVATPADRLGAAVVVLHEAFGLTSEMIATTHRFAELGYVAVAPSLFHRTGGDVIPYDRPERIALHADALRIESILDDLDATLEHLAAGSVPADRVGLVGFCLGGSLAAIVAAHRTVGAAVTFYGPAIVDSRRAYPPLLEVAPLLTNPWMGHYGDQDALAPAEEVAQLRDALATRVPTELHVYEAAGHAFARQGHSSFDERAAGLAWSRTSQWLSTHLGARRQVDPAG